MDPITALGVASNVLQFVDAGTKIIFTAYELFKSPRDSVKEHEEMEDIASDLQGLLESLKSQLRKTADPTLEKFTSDCLRLNTELLDVLDKMKIKGKRHRIFESLAVASKFQLKKGRIVALEVRINRLRDHICDKMILPAL